LAPKRKCFNHTDVDTANNRLIQRVIGEPRTFAERELKGSGIEWFAVLTNLGPARFGFDFEHLEIVKMAKAAVVVDLQPRASYGIHILSGRCLVAWRDRNAPGSLQSRRRAGRRASEEEQPEEFSSRIGHVDPKTGRLTKKNRELTYNYIPHQLEDRKGVWRHEVFLPTAFEVTIISQSKDVVLAVFSADGPGNGSSPSPGSHSTS